MPKKLSLSDLNVTSFQTSEVQHVKGGISGGRCVPKEEKPVEVEFGPYHTFYADYLGLTC